MYENYTFSAIYKKADKKCTCKFYVEYRQLHNEESSWIRLENIFYTYNGAYAFKVEESAKYSKLLEYRIIKIEETILD